MCGTKAISQASYFCQKWRNVFVHNAETCNTTITMQDTGASARGLKMEEKDIVTEFEYAASSTLNKKQKVSMRQILKHDSAICLVYRSGLRNRLQEHGLCSKNNLKGNMDLV